MSHTFEEYINFIEDEFEVKLLPSQKELLKHIYEGKQIYYMPARCSGQRLYWYGFEIIADIVAKEGQHGM